MIRVLVVGGHTFVRESLAAVLATVNDLEVREAATPAEGMQVLDQASPDLILMNHHADGEPLERFLEAAGKRGQAGKVLVISDWISDLNKQALIRAGVGGIFGRHRHLQELATAIRRVATGKRWFDECTTQVPHLFADAPVALSPQEQRAASLAAECLSNKEIATRMRVSESYVKGLLQRVFLKMGVHNRGGLIRVMIEGARSNHVSSAASYSE